MSGGPPPTAGAFGANPFQQGAPPRMAAGGPPPAGSQVGNPFGHHQQPQQQQQQQPFGGGPPLPGAGPPVGQQYPPPRQAQQAGSNGFSRPPPQQQFQQPAQQQQQQQQQQFQQPAQQQLGQTGPPPMGGRPAHLGGPPSGGGGPPTMGMARGGPPMGPPTGGANTMGPPTGFGAPPSMHRGGPPTMQSAPPGMQQQHAPPMMHPGRGMGPPPPGASGSALGASQGPPTAGQSRQPQNLQQQQHQPSQHQPTNPTQRPAQPARKPAPAARINPAHIPRQKFEPADAGSSRVFTSQEEAPPLSLLDFTTDDTNGSSSCRFIRASMYRVPATADLLGMTKMPMAVAVQPFAPQSPAERPISVVDFGTDEGPVRCGLCRAYINLFCTFLEDGRKWKCNLCQQINQVPQHYECGVDTYGKRHDATQRPELCQGSVDFVAGSNMLANTTAGPHYLFVLDVSYHALGNGTLTVCINAIRDLLNRIEDPERTRIGFIAYNTELHYFNLALASQEPRVVIVPDLEEAYAPLPFNSIMPPVAQSRDTILALLDMLPELFANVVDATVVAGAAVASAREALKGHGGRVLLFQSSLCSAGPGALANRDPGNSSKAYGTQKECSLYTPAPASSKYYTDLARSLAVEQICVDVFACTSGFVDIGTVSTLSQTTGGRLWHYENFTAANPAECQRMHTDVVRTVTGFSAFESVLKLRVGPGMEIEQSYGNFCRRTAGDEVYYPNFDDTNTALFHLRHTGKGLKNDEPVYLQAATLYTNRRGERLIRVHNLKLPATDKLTTCFRYSDLEVVLLSLIRQTCRAMVDPPTPLEQVRAELKTACVAVLTQYRKYCSGHSQPGQLILPESLKLLPIYVLGLLKTDLLRLNTSRSGVLIPSKSKLRVSADARAAMVARLNRLSFSLTTALLYPRIFDLSDLKVLSTKRSDPNASGVGPVRVGAAPELLWASAEKLSIKGMYLLENGDKLILWLGADLDSKVIDECFVCHGEGPQTRYHLKTGPTIAGTKAEALCKFIGEVVEHRKAIGASLILEIIRAGSPVESVFTLLLCEDKLAAEHSYVDFLCWIHKEIQVGVSKD